MNKEEKITKINECMEEYSLRNSLYHQFAFTIKNILEKIVDENDFYHPVVTKRVKEEKSLRKKLDSREELRSLDDIKDLVGCRVIFYLSEHRVRIEEFLQKEFHVVDWYPKFETNDYQAYHCIVKLNKKTLQINEYRNFIDLKCEIQLTTVLHHAWSELSHDFIYKKNKVMADFDPEHYDYLVEKFRKIRPLIFRAQYDFDHLFKEIDKHKKDMQILDNFNSTEIDVK